MSDILTENGPRITPMYLSLFARRLQEIAFLPGAPDDKQAALLDASEIISKACSVLTDLEETHGLAF